MSESRGLRGELGRTRRYPGPWAAQGLPPEGLGRRGRGHRAPGLHGPARGDRGHRRQDRLREVDVLQHADRPRARRRRARSRSAGAHPTGTSTPFAAASASSSSRTGCCPWRSLLDNVTLGLEIMAIDPAERRTRAERWLHRLGPGRTFSGPFRASCRAGCASGPRSPEPSPSTPRSCSPTRRSVTSTRSPPADPRPVLRHGPRRAQDGDPRHPPARGGDRDIATACLPRTGHTLNLEEPRPSTARSSTSCETSRAELRISRKKGDTTWILG